MTTLPTRLAGPRSLLACSAALLALALVPATVLSPSAPSLDAAASTIATPTAAAIWSGSSDATAATASGQGAPTAAATPTPRGADPSGNRYSTGLVASTVGQLLSPESSCTATVIGSDSGQVVVTAAHCVYIPRHHDAFAAGFRNLPIGWVGPLAFQPGRTGTRAPYGTWTVEHMWVDRAWQQTGDPRHDVAFLRLAPLNGRTAQATLGAQAVAFGSTTPAVVDGHPAVTALGYPVDAPFDGTTLRRCTTPAIATPTATYHNDLAMACRMTPGASGGPWLTQFDTTAGTGTVTAVTSFKALDASGQLYAIPLGATARGLYDAADRNA